MENCDVVFLLLRPASSGQFDQFMELYNSVSKAGFHTAIATHPFELHRSNHRLRIVVVDGHNDQDGYDAIQATYELRSRNQENQRVVFINNTLLDNFDYGSETGADVCVRGNVRGSVFCNVLSWLAYEHAQQLMSATFDTEN